MFANKYFKMSSQTPFKLAKREVPKSIERCDQITNCVFLSLNCIPPILFGIGYVVYYGVDKKSHLKLSN